MDYERAVQYVDEHIQLAIANLKIGSWVRMNEDGLIQHFTKSSYAFPTKKEAIEEIGTSQLDARRLPKVRRLHEGHYWYYVKDCDTGHDRDPVSIIKLTENNISDYQDLLKAELEYIRDNYILTVYDNPLYKDDEERGESVKKNVRLDIYNPEDY